MTYIACTCVHPTWFPQAAIFVEQASQRPLTVTLFLLCQTSMAPTSHRTLRPSLRASSLLLADGVASLGLMSDRCSCCMAVLYNVVFFQCMRSLSAVGVSVLGNVKIVLLILSSALVLTRGWTSALVP